MNNGRTYLAISSVVIVNYNSLLLWNSRAIAAVKNKQHIYLFKGTSINCHERHEYEADGAQKPLSIRPTK